MTGNKIAKDVGPYIHHVTCYPVEGHMLRKDGSRSTVPVFEYIRILKDINEIRRAMHSSEEYYMSTCQTRIATFNTDRRQYALNIRRMGIFYFDQECGYPDQCVATRRTIKGSGSRYVAMMLDDGIPTTVQVVDKPMNGGPRITSPPLERMKQPRQMFQTELVRRMVDDDAKYVTGDTKVNLVHG